MTYGSALGALADPTRRHIFERLLARPGSVGELAAELPVSRPAVSQHLRVLAEAALVRSRAEGARRVYSADPEGLGELRAYLERMWAGALHEFHTAARAQLERGRPPQRRTRRT